MNYKIISKCENWYYNIEDEHGNYFRYILATSSRKTELWSIANNGWNKLISSVNIILPFDENNIENFIERIKKLSLLV
jgi:hypothetical protein